MNKTYLILIISLLSACASSLPTDTESSTHYISMQGPSDSDESEASSGGAVMGSTVGDAPTLSETPSAPESTSTNDEPERTCHGASLSDDAETPSIPRLLVECLNLVYGTRFTCQPDEDGDLQCVEPQHSASALMMCREKGCVFGDLGGEQRQIFRYDPNSPSLGYISFDVKFHDNTYGECKITPDRRRVMGCFTPDN